MNIEELLERNGYYLAFQWDNISQGEKLFVGKNNKTICDLEYFDVDTLIELRNHSNKKVITEELKNCPCDNCKNTTSKCMCELWSKWRKI